MHYELFTDGACKGNPGPGGWGCLLREGSTESALKGGEINTTNNRMELTAAIEGLKATPIGSTVKLTTDSQYVKNGIQSWITGWKRNNWRTASKKPVKNKELWIALDQAVSERTVTWAWVKGHAGHRENEIADQLANQGVPSH
ncbi:ribonuclease HI [Neptuniibacter sp. QD37_11]|uniref:ribonuclease HI n=1 Tax=Neptuniibacter sp. QD37_11 TaxID=3398209 RepID=UPI0039F4560A